MSYNVYITRAKHFYESATRPIAELEWVTLAKADPTLRQSSTEFEEVVREDGAVERRYVWHWAEPETRVPFWYADGALRVKDPDAATRRKMAALAAKLNAKVIGEASEVYDANGERLAAPEASVERAGGLAATLRRWLKR
jgi:hypothetical protein